MATATVAMICLFDDREAAREASRLLNSVSSAHRDVLRLFADEIDCDHFWATVGEDDASRAWAHFWVGFKLLGRGDRAGARHHLKSADEIYGVPFGVRNIANTLVCRLEDDPEWPHRPTPDHSSSASPEHQGEK